MSSDHPQFVPTMIVIWAGLILIVVGGAMVREGFEGEHREELDARLQGNSIQRILGALTLVFAYPLVARRRGWFPWLVLVASLVLFHGGSCHASTSP